MKDPKMYKATHEAISRFHSVLGVRQKDIKIADLSPKYYGVHVTSGGKSEGIYLNRTYFNGGQAAKTMEARIKREYESGWQSKTNRAVGHVVIHELGHATWNTGLSSANARAAAPAVRKLYQSWMRDKKKTGWGKYATTNINEFWAEACTRAVSGIRVNGKPDKYGAAVRGIVRKYKL